MMDITLKTSLLILFLLFPFVLFAQEQDTVQSVKNVDSNEVVYMIVEQMPEFPGGELALRKFIQQNYAYPRPTPEIVAQEGVGYIYIRFMVSKTGEVKNVTVARGVHPILDKAAVDVIKKMPKWKPGIQRGQNVNVWHTIPINMYPY